MDDAKKWVEVDFLCYDNDYLTKMKRPFLKLIKREKTFA